jgi:hypothetical protein
MAVRPEVRDGLERLATGLDAQPAGRLPEASSGGAAVGQILPGIALVAILALAVLLARRELRGPRPAPS